MSVCTHRSKLNNDNKINIKKTAASAKTQCVAFKKIFKKINITHSFLK